MSWRKTIKGKVFYLCFCFVMFFYIYTMKMLEISISMIYGAIEGAIYTIKKGGEDS